MQAPPDRSTAALEFAVAAIAAGHEIERVFFLREGTQCARVGSVATRWTRLARQHAVELSVCVSGAARRNLFDDLGASQHGAVAGNIAPAFAVSGLGLLVDAIASADRVLTFL